MTWYPDLIVTCCTFCLGWQAAGVLRVHQYPLGLMLKMLAWVSSSAVIPRLYGVSTMDRLARTAQMGATTCLKQRERFRCIFKQLWVNPVYATVINFIQAVENYYTGPQNIWFVAQLIFMAKQCYDQKFRLPTNVTMFCFQLYKLYVFCSWNACRYQIEYKVP